MGKLKTAGSPVRTDVLRREASRPSSVRSDSQRLKAPKDLGLRSGRRNAVRGEFSRLSDSRLEQVETCTIQSMESPESGYSATPVARLQGGNRTADVVGLAVRFSRDYAARCAYSVPCRLRAGSCFGHEDDQNTQTRVCGRTSRNHRCFQRDGRGPQR